MPDWGRERLTDQPLSRRGFFERIAGGTYGAALAYLLSKDLYGKSSLLGAEAPRTFDLKPHLSHFEPRAKAVIHLVMQGGPSHIDLFDPKPKLARHAGQPLSKQDLAQTDMDPETMGGLLP